MIVARRSVYTQICSSLLHIPSHNAGPEALLWGRFCYHGDDTEQKESSLGTTRAMCMCVRTTTGIYRTGTFISLSVSQCQVMRSLIMLKDSHSICVLGTFIHRLTECDKIATVVENGVFYSSKNSQPFVSKCYSDHGFLYRIILTFFTDLVLYLFRIFRGGVRVGFL